MLESYANCAIMKRNREVPREFNDLYSYCNCFSFQILQKERGSLWDL